MKFDITKKAYEIFVMFMMRDGLTSSEATEETILMKRGGITAEMNVADMKSAFIRYSRVGSKRPINRKIKLEYFESFLRACNHADFERHILENS